MHPDCRWFLECAHSVIRSTRDTVLARVYLRNAMKTATGPQRMRIMKVLKHLRKWEQI